MTMPHTRIGCETYIIKNDKILLGRRGNVHGKGTWALPGGHLEHLERADSGFVRELQEEMGLNIDPASIKLIALTDDLQPEAGVHYVHITFAVDIEDQELRLLEPEACEEWRWFLLDEMPDDIFPPHAKIFKTLESGNVYTLSLS